MPQALSLLVIICLCIILSTSSCASPVHERGIAPETYSVTRDMSLRSTDTCADPSLTHPVFEAFSGVDTLHILQFREAFVNANSRQGSGPAFWTFPQAMFNAWATQQPFTAPLFRFFTPSLTDAVYAIGEDAQTPPVMSGFGAGALVAWVYNTSICESVPLMGAALASATDHYYTTDSFEHSQLLADGWTDTGVVAFVLPVSTS